MGLYEAGMGYATNQLKFQIARRWLETVMTQFTQKNVEIKFAPEVRKKLGLDD
jgi:hypothetical protein